MIVRWGGHQCWFYLDSESGCRVDRNYYSLRWAIPRYWTFCCPSFTVAYLHQSLSHVRNGQRYVPMPILRLHTYLVHDGHDQEGVCRCQEAPHCTSGQWMALLHLGVCMDIIFVCGGWPSCQSLLPVKPRTQIQAPPSFWFGYISSLPAGCVRNPFKT